MVDIAVGQLGWISERTKAALAAAKARGVVLGGWKAGPKVNGRLGAMLSNARRRHSPPSAVRNVLLRLEAC